MLIWTLYIFDQMPVEDWLGALATQLSEGSLNYLLASKLLQLLQVILFLQFSYHV